jgi:glyoxylase-like metal-dependent hydrolase (beta-lactamase superfamily II)
VRRLRSLDVDLVLPGHGPPFGDHRRVIDGLLDFHERRQARIREALASGSLTAFEVTRALFPSAGPRDLFLVVSEAIANLEVMEVRGEVVRALRGDVYRFTASR